MGWTSVAPLASPKVRPPTGRAWALAVLPLALYTRALEVPDGVRGWLLGWVLPLGLLGLGLLLVARRSMWLVLPGAAATVLLAGWVLPAAGPQVATVLVLGCLAWGAGLGVLRIQSARSAEQRTFWLPLPLAAAASVLLVLGRTLWLPAVLLGCSALFGLSAVLLPRAAGRLLTAGEPLVAVAGGPLRRVSNWLDRCAGLVGSGVRVLVMIPALVVVTVLWLVHRLVGFDPLRSSSGPDTRWVVRTGSDPHPGRQYGAVPTLDRRTLRQRLSAAGVVATFGLMLAVVLLLFRQVGPPATSTPPIQAPTPATDQPANGACGAPPTDPVLSQQEDSAELVCEQSRAFARGEYDPPAGYRMSDFAGSTLNVTDGVRRNWTPPECDCKRLTVWWFGGSAAWGEGQRDDHTIPSMLARRAREDGIVLDIENRAMPTWTFGQEVHAFADLLSTGRRPDLAVFYTGGNDVVFQGLRLLEGRPDDSSDIVLQQRHYSDLLRKGIPVRPAETEWSPDPVSFEQALTVDMARSLAPAVTSRLSRNLELAEILGRGSGTEVAMVFQPLLAGSAAAAGPAGAVDPTLLASFTELVKQVAGDLPDGSLDVSDVYADIGEPVFFDLFHTGERGAQIAAERVYELLRPRLIERQNSDGD